MLYAVLFRGVKFKIMAVFEIKFRGQRIDNNEWVYGYYVKDPKGKHRIYWQPFGEASSNTYHFVKEESVGQMWKPSEGLTLFTGDLLHAECSPSGSHNKKQRLCKVVFEPRGMNVSVWHKGEWWAYGSMNFTTAKVIGNVVDNPELLGVAQHSI